MFLAESILHGFTSCVYTSPACPYPFSQFIDTVSHIRETSLDGIYLLPDKRIYMTLLLLVVSKAIRIPVSSTSPNSSFIAVPNIFIVGERLI